MRSQMCGYFPNSWVIPDLSYRPLTTSILMEGNTDIVMEVESSKGDTSLIRWVVYPLNLLYIFIFTITPGYVPTLRIFYWFLFCFSKICKLDVSTKEALIWKGSDTLYPGECQFIPRPGSTEEDDGVILSIVLESDETKPHFLLILDGKSFKELARAQIHINEAHIPATIHGLFTPKK